MPSSASFRDLKVWQDSMTLVEEVYRVTRTFPPDERFGLTSQLRRASVSIPSNIGEGWRRKKRKPYVYFLEVALGSQAEVDVQLELARRLSLCATNDHKRLQKLVDEIGRMLNGLIKSLQPSDDH